MYISFLMQSLTLFYFFPSGALLSKGLFTWRVNALANLVTPANRTVLHVVTIIT